jgi:integrase
VQVHRIMHAAFRDAVRLQVLRFNPCDGVTLPRVKSPALSVPEAREVACLVERMDPAYRTALALAAGTGLRRGEVLAMRWPVVELDGPHPQLQVQGTLQRTPTGLVTEAEDGAFGADGATVRRADFDAPASQKGADRAPPAGGASLERRGLRLRPR